MEAAVVNVVDEAIGQAIPGAAQVLCHAQGVAADRVHERCRQLDQALVEIALGGIGRC